MKTAVILMAVLMASEVYAKAKYYVPALVALSSLASCAIGARQASHNHSASFYCTHFDFITYSGKDTDFTQKEIQDYNKKVCGSMF